MTDEILIVVQLIIGVVFLRAVIGKLRAQGHLSSGIEAFGIVPGSLADLVGILLVAMEFLVALSHISGLLLFPSTIATAGLLLVMLGASIAVIQRGDEVSCACFGEGSDEIVSKKTIARLCLLLTCEFALIAGILADLYDGSIAMLRISQFAFAVVAAVLLAVLGSWVLRTSEYRALWAQCAACRRKQEG